MALYHYHGEDYRIDLFKLYDHAKRVAERNEIPMEAIFDDLIIKNLHDY